MNDSNSNDNDNSQNGGYHEPLTQQQLASITQQQAAQAAIAKALAPYALERLALGAINQWFEENNNSIGPRSLDSIVQELISKQEVINYMTAATTLKWGNIAENYVKREISYNLRCWIDKR